MQSKTTRNSEVYGDVQPTNYYDTDRGVPTDLITYAEYVANLVNVVVNVYYMRMLYLHNDILLTFVTGYDRLKFS